MNFLSRPAIFATLFFSIICGCNILVEAQELNPKTNPRAVYNPKDPAQPTHVGVDSAQTVPLTLDEAIRRALENNNNIEVARADVKIAESRLRSLMGVYDPNFAVTPNYTRSSQGGSQPTNNFSVDVTGTQLLKTGGRIQPFFNNSRSSQLFTTSPDGTTTQTVSSTGSFYRSSAGVSFVQPLLRNRSIDVTRRNIRVQRKSLQQSDADFRRITIETISQVQRAYWDLVFALRDQQNRVANLNLTRESLRITEARIAAGSAPPLSRAEIATELANRESELLVAQQQVSIADNTLKQLLLRDSTSPEWSQQLVPTEQPRLDMTPINLADALADARANRPELRRLQLQKEINAIDIEYFRNQTKPQVDLNSSFSLNGFSQNFGGTTGTSTSSPLLTNASDVFLLQAINNIRPVGTPEIVNPIITNPPQVIPSGGFGNSLGNLFTSNSPNYTVGMTIGFPLRNQTAKADLAGARLQQQQLDAQNRSTEQNVMVEVRNAVQAVETARLRVMTARRARENAEIQLQGEQKLYEVGRSTTFLLFQRENTLANARNAEIRAETDYNKAISDLQRATSTTFRANNIEVDSPMEENK